MTDSDRMNAALYNLVNTLRAGKQHDSYCIGWLQSMFTGIMQDSRVNLTKKQRQAIIDIIEYDARYAQQLNDERLKNKAA
jgi:hypothetical protein